MNIGIITAMSSEQKQLADQLTDKSEVTIAPYTYIKGRIRGNDVVLMQCGIGKVNAAAGTVELIRNFRPDCVISTGVAGGIDECLRVMDVVVSRQTAYHDVWCGEGNAYGQVQGLPARFDGDERFYRAALSLDTPTRIHGGLICTGDQFISERAALDHIKANFPDGLAVDMESAAIAQVCHLHSTPFISFRIISDCPVHGEENFSQYVNFWQEMADRSFRVTETFLHALPENL